MAEEIRIKVIQENQGDALKKAAEDADRLKNNGGKSSLATPPPNINAPQPATKQEATAARREAAQRNKALISDAEEDLVKARARGASASVVGDLENQLRERKLTARFMREQNLPEDEAIQKSRGLVSAQNEAKVRKQTQVEIDRQSAADKKRAAQEAARAEAEVLKAARQAYRNQQNAESDAGGGDGGGGMGNLFSGAMIASLVGRVAVAGLSFVKRIYDDDLERTRREREIAAHGIEDTNTTRQIMDMPGVRGEDAASANYQAKRAEREALERKRGTFHGIDGGGWDQFKSGLKGRFGFKTWFGQSPIETDAERGERENEEKISQAQVAEQAAKKEAQQKFRGGTGADELAASRARLAGHMQEARAIEYKILAQKSYDALYEKSGSDEMAKEGAQLAVAERAKADAGSFAKLINARDGAADVARVATAAHHYRMETQGMATQVLEKIYQQNKKQHAQAMTAVTRHNFSR